MENGWPHRWRTGGHIYGERVATLTENGRPHRWRTGGHIDRELAVTLIGHNFLSSSSLPYRGGIIGVYALQFVVLCDIV